MGLPAPRGCNQETRTGQRAPPNKSNPSESRGQPLDPLYIHLLIALWSHTVHCGVSRSSVRSPFHPPPHPSSVFSAGYATTSAVTGLCGLRNMREMRHKPTSYGSHRPPLTHPNAAKCALYWMTKLDPCRLQPQSVACEP